MRIAILGASTGGGHISVMKSLSAQFNKRGITVEEYPTFYEDLYESNRILSNFYNMSQAKSMKLAVLLNEIMVAEGKRQRERLYSLYTDSLDRFFRDKRDIIISTSSLINYHIIRFFAENRVGYNISFHIIVTDPFKPMYPGFDVIGATSYFCPTDTSKKQLVESGIDVERIFTFGYPVDSAFYNGNLCNADELRKTLNINKDIVIMINCGAAGSFSFFDMIVDLVQNTNHVHYLIVCGNNKALHTIIQNSLPSKDNYTLVGYADNMSDLYKLTDLCISKPGANTFFEQLITNTVPIIYDFEGLMYQEKGVHNFLAEEIGLDLKFANAECLKDFIARELDLNKVKELKKKISTYKQKDAANETVMTILRGRNGLTEEFDY